MKEKKEFMDLAVLAVDRAKKAGADAAEAFISDAESVQVSVSNRQVEQVNAVREAGVGLRLLKGQKMVSGSTNDLSRDALQNLIEDLLRKVPYHTSDEFNGIAGKEIGSPSGDWSSQKDLITYDPRISEVPVQQKIERALTVEAAGLDFSPKVNGSMFIVYQDSTSHIYLANSNGVSGWFPTSSCGGAAAISAAEGNDRQSGSYSKAAAQYEEFNPEEIGQKAAGKAVNMLGAKPIPSCEVPLVVSPEIGTQLFSFLAGMLSADEVQKGRSLFAGKLGKKVAADTFNLVDDGCLKGGLATSPVDGEGMPPQTTPLIVDGVLNNFLYDCYTARKGKTNSTGNYSRGSFTSSGSIQPTNLYLTPGLSKPEEIFSGLQRGFYLTDAIGIFAGINMASGDFSIPVAGFLIEKGKLSSPVRGVSIGGNLFDLLKSVVKIADDLTWFNSVGCPTFLVSGVRIGGAKS